MGSISWSAALVHLHRNKEVLESFLMLLYAFWVFLRCFGVFSDAFRVILEWFWVVLGAFCILFLFPRASFPIPLDSRPVSSASCCFFVYLCSFVSVCVFSVLFLLFPSCSPLISSCLLFFLQSFMIKRNRNYEAPPLCLSDEDNLEPVTIRTDIDFACRKGSTAWWKVRWERLLIGSFFPLADPGLWMKWQRHHRCCFMLYQGIFSFSLILRALFLFTRPGLAAFIGTLVYGDAFGPFPMP